MRPVLLRTTTSSSSSSYTSGVYCDTDVTVDASTGTLTATKFVGAAASTTEAGLMSAEDKTKLDGITADADAVSYTKSISFGQTLGTLVVNGTSYTIQNGSEAYQSYYTSSSERHLLFSSLNGTSTVNATASLAHNPKFTANPSTGILTAPILFGNQIFGATVALTSGTVSVKSGSAFTKTITAATTFTFSDVSKACACFALILTNGGAYTVTWPSSVKWSDGEVPTLTSDGVDVLVFMTSDTGTIWYGNCPITDARAA